MYPLPLPYRRDIMQPCSIRQLGSFRCQQYFFSAAQLLEARQMHGLLRHTQMPSRLSLSGNLRIADNLHRKVPEVIPYAMVHMPFLEIHHCQMTDCSEASIS